MIKNLEKLTTTPNRQIALEVMQAGLSAISTKDIIQSSIILKDDTLSICGDNFDLNKFKNIKVVGFGKSSGVAALALEEILGDRIKSGAVVGIEAVPTKYIESFVGTHPKPSEMNTQGGRKVYEIIKDSKEEDLVFVLVSGGGSALLSYPDSEYEQGAKLYDAFLKSGKTISEINTVRKHLSLMKGGGLAKIAYPATVVGLIFSDVPGDKFEDVASGPTYKDKTTLEDAQNIIKTNNLGEFDLVETPKEDKYFEKVKNFVLVSNKIALEAMAKKARELNLGVNIVSTDLYDEVSESLRKIFHTSLEFKAGIAGKVSLAAGEPSLVVSKKGGKGGRNLHMGLEVIKNKLITDEKSVFISFASDGMDNTDMAGAVVDMETIKKAEHLKLNPEEYSSDFDSYNFFKQTGDLIDTGPTGANVSDLMILLNKDVKETL
jgi:glycerate-2-kinase